MTSNIWIMIFWGSSRPFPFLQAPLHPSCAGPPALLADPTLLLGPKPTLGSETAYICSQNQRWAANKRFKILKFKFKFPRARTFELFRARSRLYRSQILQVNTRWKTLAEIYTKHSFAPFSTLTLRRYFWKRRCVGQIQFGIFRWGVTGPWYISLINWREKHSAAHKCHTLKCLF